MTRSHVRQGKACEMLSRVAVGDSWYAWSKMISLTWLINFDPTQIGSKKWETKMSEILEH